MLFRFTLNNTIEGSQVISNPDGWKEIKLKLERDKEYHSLVEMIELPLIFCGSDGSYDGGYNYIRNIEDTQGIDAQIEILIEVSEDQGATYETFFEGLLELETIKEISDAEPYKLECNIVRNDFWSKFFNRKSQQIDLSSIVDVDGEIRSLIDNITLYLPSQKMRLRDRIEYFTFLEATSLGAIPIFFTFSNARPYGILELPKEIIKEVNKKYSYLLYGSTSPGNARADILENYSFELSGLYVFDIQIYMSTSDLLAFSDRTASLDLKLKINDGTPETFTITQEGTNGLDGRTKFTINTTKNIVKGDFVYIYFEYGAAGPINYFLVYKDASGNYESYIDITADTTTPNTTTEAFLLRDAAESILSKVIGRDDVVYSNYLGDETPTACAANFALMKGLHVRGYAMSDKPMFMSFNNWWEGANPIFNLGLGYEVINGTEYIRIEDKGYFYDDDYSITFSNVDKITRLYDKDKVVKSIEIGYQKWSAESSSGVDDPQTKHTYNTRLKIVGKDETVLSKFFAASLGIEQTRRNRSELGKDWRLDEEIMIIALQNDATPFQPETNESFNNITDLLNSDTRYNIRLTPARNFERWKPFFNGCLQLYIPETFKFASGEGNYIMSSDGQDSCDSGVLAENQNIDVTTDFYHGPGSYEFEFPMSWADYKTIRDNRNKAIRVSNTTSNYKICKIDVMEYDHFNSMAEFTVWIKE